MRDPVKGAVPPAVAERVRAAMDENPELPPREVAKRAGCHPWYVHEIRRLDAPDGPTRKRALVASSAHGTARRLEKRHAELYGQPVEAVAAALRRRACIVAPAMMQLGWPLGARFDALVADLKADRDNAELYETYGLSSQDLSVFRARADLPRQTVPHRLHQNLQLLDGTRTDREVAAILGIDAAYVGLVRRSLGVSNAKADATKRAQQLVERLSDPDFAKLRIQDQAAAFDLGTSAVERARRRFRVMHPDLPSEHFRRVRPEPREPADDASPESDARPAPAPTPDPPAPPAPSPDEPPRPRFRRLEDNPAYMRVAPWLGKVPDRALAPLGNTTADVIARWRGRRGIGEAPANAPIPIDVELGAFRDLLGVAPDRMIAREAGVKAARITLWRWYLGIAPPPKQRADNETLTRLGPHRDRLGQQPDVVIAEVTGVPAFSVRDVRLRLGFPPVRQHPALDRILERRHELGVRPSTEIAAEIGVSKAYVHLVCDWLGVTPKTKPSRGRSEPARRIAVKGGTPAPPFDRTRFHGHPRLESDPRFQAVSADLGVVNDAVLARRVGVRASDVFRWRGSYGIPAAPRPPAKPPKPRKQLPWQEQFPGARALLGVLPDAEIAARFNVREERVAAWRERLGIADAFRTPSARERIAAVRHLLGELSDAEIARRTRTYPAAVRAFRLANAIPTAQAAGVAHRVQLMLDDHRELIGVLSDSAIARRLGIAASSVHNYRNKLGLPSPDPRGKRRVPVEGPKEPE